jgi:hypothetical protein
MRLPDMNKPSNLRFSANAGPIFGSAKTANLTAISIRSDRIIIFNIDRRLKSLYKLQTEERNALP